VITMTKRPPKLSLCMLVKNEEDVLSRCLKTVAGLVGESVIVDTGSTDSTKEIAKSFNALVFDYEWDDNFSNARNFALARASGEWILVLDADEVLMYNDRDQFIKLLEDPQVEGYFIRIINLLGKPPDIETSEDWVVRLFRNRPEYRFSGAIHEQVRPSIVCHAGTNALKKAPVTIYHDGYLSDVIFKKNKVARNSKIIGKALAKTPADPFLLYSLGCEYFLAENFSGALELFDRALSMIPAGEGYLPDLIIKLGLCLYKLGRTEDMLRLVSRYQEISPLSPELLFLSGLVNLDLGCLGEAERVIKECLNRLPIIPTHHLAIREFQVYQVLGEIHEAKQCWDEAVRFYLFSAKAKPNYLYPLEKLINIYKNHTPGVAIEECLGFCPPETKCGLLAKLDWENNNDAAIFIIMGLIRDIIVSGLGVSQLLASRAEAILRQKESSLENMRLLLAVALAKAVFALSGFISLEVGTSGTFCEKIMQQMKQVLLIREIST